MASGLYVPFGAVDSDLPHELVERFRGSGLRGSVGVKGVRIKGVNIKGSGFQL